MRAIRKAQQDKASIPSKGLEKINLLISKDLILVQKSFYLILDLCSLSVKEIKPQKKLEMLMNEGNTVRVYLPYGDNWYDYSVRRLKENPKMAGYIIKNLLLSIFRIK